MNWIISKTKISFHTHIHEILKPIWKDLFEYNWVITDIDFITDDNIPLDFNHDYFIFNRKEFETLYLSSTQIIWGIISAIPIEIRLDTKFISTLSAEDIRVWQSNEFLISESVVEIIAFDSSYTIVKFKDEKLSNMFKEYFQEEAVDLQKFNDKYIS
jgi:hypothetical protein